MASSKATSKGIPEPVLEKLVERLNAHASREWPACRLVAVRSKGAFAYVDVQGPEDRQPEPICRLRYTGSIDAWEFSYFTWARETYERSFLATGSPVGTPEACFDASAFSVLPQR